jgi:hypothetical protein
MRFCSVRVSGELVMNRPPPNQPRAPSQWPARGANGLWGGVRRGLWLARTNQVRDWPDMQGCLHTRMGDLVCSSTGLTGPHAAAGEAGTQRHGKRASGGQADRTDAWAWLLISPRINPLSRHGRDITSMVGCA